MVVENIIRAIRVLEENKDFISTEHYDESLSSRVGVPTKKKSVQGWICYELDKDNYPKTWEGYIFYEGYTQVHTLLGLTRYISLGTDYRRAIIILLDLLKEVTPLTEVINHLQLIESYSSFYKKE